MTGTPGSNDPERSRDAAAQPTPPSRPLDAKEVYYFVPPPPELHERVMELLRQERPWEKILAASTPKSLELLLEGAKYEVTVSSAKPGLLEVKGLRGRRLMRMWEHANEHSVFELRAASETIRIPLAQLADERRDEDFTHNRRYAAADGDDSPEQPLTLLKTVVGGRWLRALTDRGGQLYLEITDADKDAP